MSLILCMCALEPDFLMLGPLITSLLVRFSTSFFANCTSFLFCASYGLCMIHCVFVGGLWDLMLGCREGKDTSMFHLSLTVRMNNFWSGDRDVQSPWYTYTSVPHHVANLWTGPWGSGVHPILHSHSLDWSVWGQGSARLVVKCQQ